MKVILKNYTQLRHFQILFDKYNLPKKSSRNDMIDYLQNEIEQPNLVGSLIPDELFEDWLALHQIDGNNYSFIYNLDNKPKRELLQNIYLNRDKHINHKLSEFNIDNTSDDIETVLPNLNKILLVGLHRNNEKGEYIFSYIAPCVITGTLLDGTKKLYKRIYFAHCVLFDDSNDLKIVINPTSNLLNVNGVSKQRYDWSPIATQFFNEFKKLVGKHTIIAPKWIPRA